jgi:hypothetical protein
VILLYRQRGAEVLLGHPGGPFWSKKDEAEMSGRIEHNLAIGFVHKERAPTDSRRSLRLIVTAGFALAGFALFGSALARSDRRTKQSD